MRTTLIITAALAALSATAQPVLAAPLECKPAVLGIGAIDDDAIDSWQVAARQAYGSGWDNFDLARGKQWAQLNLALSVQQTVSASPCRPAKYAQINNNIGGLTMQPVHTEDPNPKPSFGTKFGKFNKLGKFGG